MHPLSFTLTSQANFTLMMECTPESGRYHSVYFVGLAVDYADYLKPSTNIVFNSINKPFFKFSEVSALS